MDIIAENKLKMASQFYYCLVKSVSNNKCTIVFNNKEYVVPFYGGSPKANKTYAVFLPQNNMNQAFVIGEGASGGGGSSGIAIQPDPPVGDELVWIDTDDPGTTHIIPEIDDDNVSSSDTWSSQKIAEAIAGANDSDTGYCKMPDGTLIQWGVTEFKSGSTSSYISPIVTSNITLTMPIPFADTNYIVFGSGRYSTGLATAIGFYSASTTTAYAHWWDAAARTFSATTPLVVRWCAIGRWK